MKVRLSDAWLDKKQKTGLHWDTRTSGLGVSVGRDGFRKSFVFQDFKHPRKTIGKHPIMSLREASAKANEIRHHGLTNRRTINGLHESWARRLLNKGGSQRTVDDMTRRLLKHCPNLLDRAADDVRKQDLYELGDEILEKSESHHSARDVVAHLVKLINLTREVPIRVELISRPKSNRAERSTDIGSWWPDIEGAASNRMLDAHLVIALTGLRKSEVLKLTKEDVEDGWATIRKPKAKLDDDRTFRRPLPLQVIKILDRQPTSGQRFFPMGDIRIGKENFAHRLRHHFRGIAETKSSAAPRAIDILMNHKTQSGAGALYGSVEDEDLERWAQEIADIIGKLIKIDTVL